MVLFAKNLEITSQLHEKFQHYDDKSIEKGRQYYSSRSKQFIEMNE